MIDPRGIMNLIPMLRFTAALIIGIFIGDMLLEYIKPLEWLVAAIISCLLGIWVMKKPILSSFLVFVTIIYCGAGYISYKESLSPEYSPHHLRCEGVIISEPVQKGKVVQCEMLITKGWQDHAVKVRASIRRDSLSGQNPFSGQNSLSGRSSLSGQNITEDTLLSLSVGTTLRWVSTVQKPHEWKGHDDRHFSYMRWMHIHDYEANVFLAKGQWEKADVDLSSMSWWQKVQLRFLEYRSRLLHEISSSGIDDESFAVVAAMTMGDKTFLKKTQKDMFSIAGAAHVLALSGMHIGIIMFLLTIIVGGKKRIRLQLFALITVWLYVMFAGMPISAVRAALMMSLWYVLHSFSRSQHPLNVLGATAFIMLMINPEMVFDVGFQMSFMAVFFIFLCMPFLIEHRPFRPKENKKNKRVQPSLKQRLWRWAYSLICISCVAQLGTMPLTMYYFGRFSCYFLLTNLIVLPLSMLVIYATLILVIAIIVQVFVNPAASILAGIMTLMNGSLDWISVLPGASIENIDINIVQVLALYVVIFCVVALIPKVMYKTPKQWKIGV